LPGLAEPAISGHDLVFGKLPAARARIMAQQLGQVVGAPVGRGGHSLNQAQELRFIFGGQGLGVLGAPGFNLHALAL
jgi:hypothetical protein